MERKSLAGPLIPGRKGPPKGPEKKGKSTRDKERAKAKGSGKGRRGREKAESLQPTTPVAKPKSLNTFIMTPTRPFKRDIANRVLQYVVEETCDGFRYTPEDGPLLAEDLADNIMASFRQLRFKRHKLVCSVDVVENEGQEYRSTAKYLWDVANDDYAYYSKSTIGYIVTASVFAFYFE